MQTVLVENNRLRRYVMLCWRSFAASAQRCGDNASNPKTSRLHVARSCSCRSSGKDRLRGSDRIKYSIEKSSKTLALRSSCDNFTTVARRYDDARYQ